MVSEKIVISNKTGFHVRPASVLAKKAESCSSVVEILYKHNIVNAKSLLNILSASIKMGDEIELRCTGAHEAEDLALLTETIRNLKD